MENFWIKLCLSCLGVILSILILIYGGNTDNVFVIFIGAIVMDLAVKNFYQIK